MLNIDIDFSFQFVFLPHFPKERVKTKIMASASLDLHLSDIDMKSLSGTDMIEEMMSNRPEDDGSHGILDYDPLSNDLLEENSLQIAGSSPHPMADDDLGIPVSDHELHGNDDDSLNLAALDQADISLTSASSNKKSKNSKKPTIIRRKFGDSTIGDENNLITAPVRKWQQKRVQVKTLEGEFSVLMWTCGKFVE